MDNLASPATVRELAAAYGLRPSRRLGQNFLVDGNIVRRAVSEAQLQGTETVVEVGPGFGALTQELLRHAARVVAVERDPVLVRVLRDRLGPDPKLFLVEGDARAVRWAQLLEEAEPAVGPAGEAAAARPKLVANLPYAVTGPVLAGLLESGVPWQQGVVMVQREVAERMTAPPGGRVYGAFTCLIAYHAEARIAARVPPTVFWPRPEVESALVALQFRRHPGTEGVPREPLFQVIRLAFQQRRKTLRQALRAQGGFWPEPAVDRALEQAGIAPNRRAETLDLNEYGRLTLCLLDR